MCAAIAPHWRWSGVEREVVRDRDLAIRTLLFPCWRREPRPGAAPEATGIANAAPARPQQRSAGPAG